MQPSGQGGHLCIIKLKITHTMKSLSTLVLVLCFYISATAQNIQSLDNFEKILISPKIEVELVQGEAPSISWEAINIDESKVRINQKRNKLAIYLEDAKLTTKYAKGKYGWKYPMYNEDVKVKAVVTYVSLKRIEIRGEENITILSDLDVDKKMVIKAYGASNIKIEGINTNKLKTVLIGENELEIKSGVTKNQKIKTIGENSIVSNNLSTSKTKASAIGENQMSLSVSNILQIWAIGASDIRIMGNPNLYKGLVIGENEISLKH